MSDQAERTPTGIRRRHVVVAALLVVAIWAGGRGYRLATLRGGAAGRFNAELVRLAEEAQEGASGQRDGWADFAEAGRRHTGVLGEYQPAERPAGWPGGASWPPLPSDQPRPAASEPVRAAMRSFLAREEAAGVTRALDVVAARHRFVRIYADGEPLVWTAVPETGAARGLGLLCDWRMYFAATDKNPQEFLRALRHGLILSEVCKRQVLRIDHAAGASIDIAVAKAVRDAVRDGLLDPPVCREALDLLNHCRRFDPVRGIRAEEVFARDTVEWTHSNDGRGDGRVVPGVMVDLMEPLDADSPVGAEGMRRLELLFGPTKKETSEMFARFFAVARAEAALPLRARLAPGRVPADAFVRLVDPRYALVRSLVPGVSRYVNRADAADLEVAGAKVMLALELHRAAQGSYPPTLGGLGPALAGLSLQPVWRAEFRYRVLGRGEDPSGRGYLLYWIGLDGTDDGGRTLPSGDNRPPFDEGAQGYDYVLNPPAKPSEGPKTEGPP